MKKLKKLTLNKEVIVNLNNSDMNRMRGGSSQVCASIGAVTAVTAMSIAGYGLGENHSWWNCANSNQANCMSNVSQQWQWAGNQQYCMLDEVVIYGFGG